jgi:uncharacterized membrane protein YhiD involved in acid resistance
MPEWLQTPPGASATAAIAPESMLVRLLLALAFGIGVAVIYRLSHGREQRDTRTLSATIVLLSVLIAMVSMVIGDSVAKAFSLVGALSIVRFRTVVEDTRDTAFVIFAVVVGMAAGANVPLLPLIGIPVVGAAAIAMSRLGMGSAREPRRATAERTLVVRLGLGFEPTATLRAALESCSTRHMLVATATARQGTALEVTYEIALRADTDESALVQALNRIEGVQSVELRLP